MISRGTVVWCETEPRKAEPTAPRPREQPATGWLTGVALDEHGFVRTDVHLTSEDLGETWSALGRGPLPFETSVPGVFAVGDVRHGSMKRVAAADGEGASAVRSVHTAIGVRA
jgi:thioredoxin reductase (NADPH)